MDFAELAADIAVEAEQAQVLTAQMADLDARIANLYAEADPDGIIRSAPGVGPVIAGIIAGRLGDPHRFTSLAAVRSYAGLVPKVNQSGTSDKPGGLTKAGDPLLREAAWMAAEQARRLTRREIQTADGRRPAPRLGRVSHRDHPAHPDRDLLAAWRALPDPRPRRCAADHGRRQEDRHRAATDGEEEEQGPAVPGHQPQGRPGASGVAKRSNIPACQTPA